MSGSAEHPSTLYIHTISGKPAAFDGNQLAYIHNSGQTWANPCYSYREMISQRNKDIKFREKYDLCDMSMSYGYFRMKI